MELPNHVWDEVRPRASRVAFDVVLAIYRHGRQIVNTDGQRVCYISATVSQLAKLASVDRRSLQRGALSELIEIGALVRHEPNGPKDPPGWTVPYDGLLAAAPCRSCGEGCGAMPQAGAAKPATPCRRCGTMPQASGTISGKDSPHGGGGGDLSNDLIEDQDLDPPNTTTMDPEGCGTMPQLRAELEAIGVSDPDAVIASYEQRAIEVALDRFDWHTRNWTPDNPPGYFMTRLWELAARPKIVEREYAALLERRQRQANDPGYIGAAWADPFERVARRYPDSPWARY